MFYTNFLLQYSDKIYWRGYDDEGKQFFKEVTAQPFLFLPSKEETGYKTIYGQKVGKIEFENITSLRHFLNDFFGMNGFQIFGLESYLFHYVFINEVFGSEQINYDSSLIRVMNMDLEVISPDGSFPDVATPTAPIVSFAASLNGRKVLFSLDEFEAPNGVLHRRFTSEGKLLMGVLKLFNEWKPDIITGWNVKFFDIPYLLKRVEHIFGADILKDFSPFGLMPFLKRKFIYGRHQLYSVIPGISVLDYLDIYKNFTYSDRPSYKLDYIGELELGLKKIDYSEYSSIFDFYAKNKQKFLEYNIRDVEIVEQLDKKFDFLNLIYSMAYDARTNYEDVLGTVRYSDIHLHNFLMKRKKVVINKGDLSNGVPKEIQKRYVKGGYVKSPNPGKYKYLVSFDLNSMYPHLFMQYNISPETYKGKVEDIYQKSLGKEGYDVIDFLIENMDKIKERLKEKNLCMTANGLLFSKEKRGFIPEVMERTYKERSEHKKRKIEAEKRLEDLKDKLSVEERKKLESIVIKENAFQQAKKIQMNSLYGAFLNEWFRWYDPDLGEAVTLSGQLSIRYAGYKINEFLNNKYKTNKDWIIITDTDSLFVNCKEIVEFHGISDDQAIDFLNEYAENVLMPVIRKCYEELAENMNVNENKMFMKREYIVKSLVCPTKKRYAMLVVDDQGVRYSDPKLVIKGLEPVRSSTPKACREKIMEALKIMLGGNEKEFWEFVEQFREEFFNLEFEDIANATSVNKLDEYMDSEGRPVKGTPFHIKGAIAFNNYLKKNDIKAVEPIRNGDKAFYCYLKMPNPLDSEVVTLSSLHPSLGLKEYIDYNTQFQKNFIKPLESVAKVIGWKLENKGSIDEWLT